MPKILDVRLVSRNDTAANWASINPVLLKGELGVEMDTRLMKIGDGSSSWNDLGYVNGGNEQIINAHYEATAEGEETDLKAIARVVGETVLNNNDTAVVKRVINGDKYSYTAYVYEENAWKAMDGNYNAENVYFEEDLVTTSAVGNIKLTNGQATISAAGKNLKQVFDTIFVEEKNPSITQPSVSVSSSQAKAYEAGTTVTPTLNATFNVGSYTYGPATGVSATGWTFTDTEGGSFTSDSGNSKTQQMTEIQVGDSTQYTMTATATYGDGAIPVTNTGNKYEAGQIKAGSKSATTSTKITGYRNFFYGAVNNTNVIDSALIRGLTAGGAYNGSKTLNVTCGGAAQRVIIAWPASVSRSGISEVLLTTSMNADITGEYKAALNVDVEGADGYTAVAYKVFVYAPASGCAGEKHQIKLA